MAEKELAIILRAKDLASRTIAGVRKEVGTLGKVGTRAMQGLTTAITRVGLAATVGLVGAVGMGIRSLADLQRTEAQTAAVIASTGSAAGQTNASIRKHAQELENLSTVDDKVIQDGQNMLLTFTNIKGKVFPDATKATLNLAVAMAKGDASQVDMKASAIQVGKALNDPIKGVTALRKVGVAFTEAQVKQIKALVKTGDVLGAQKIILKELEVEFGNAAEAAGKGPAATWRRLQDVGEDLSQALARGLLPVLERAGTWLTTKLADPAVVATIDEIGQGLGRAASEAMDFIETIDFKAIGAGLRTAAGFAGGIVKAFMGMPDWVKTAVITGWGLNKLSGGAVSSIIGSLASGLIKGILNMNAGVVNINAGVVNGGGIPGGKGIPPVAGAPTAGAVAGLLAPGLGTAIAGVLTPFLMFNVLPQLISAKGGNELKPGQNLGLTTTANQTMVSLGLGNQLARTDAARRAAPGSTGGQSPDEREALRNTRELVTATHREREQGVQIRTAIDKETAAVTRLESSTAPSQKSAEAHLAQLRSLQSATPARDSAHTSQIVSAIARLERVIGRPPTVNVNVTAADITRAQNRRRRVVKPGGPRSLVGANEFG